MNDLCRLLRGVSPGFMYMVPLRSNHYNWLWEVWEFKILLDCHQILLPPIALDIMNPV